MLRQFIAGAAIVAASVFAAPGSVAQTKGTAETRIKCFESKASGLLARFNTGTDEGFVTINVMSPRPKSLNFVSIVGRPSKSELDSERKSGGFYYARGPTLRLMQDQDGKLEAVPKSASSSPYEFTHTAKQKQSIDAAVRDVFDLARKVLVRPGLSQICNGKANLSEVGLDSRDREIGEIERRLRMLHALATGKRVG